MNKRHPYNSIIERKLEQLPIADTGLLWNDMHSILDKKMPQKKERRRFVAWFLSSQGVLVLTIVFLVVTDASLFFLSRGGVNSPVSIDKMPGAPNSNKILQDHAGIGFRETGKNMVPANTPNQENQESIATTVSSTNRDVRQKNNNFIIKETIKNSAENTSIEQFNQPVIPVSNNISDIEIIPLHSKSVYQDFRIATGQNKRKDSPGGQPESSKNPAKAKPKNNIESGFYAGVVTGVDVSSIRFRSARTGSSKGLIIGYAFNKNWSIESGLLWDTKRVHDNGENFTPPGYVPTSGITIVAVNGKSRLYELPFNMKYTINSGKHSLFATSGLSSYFMKSENYDYEYTQNNQPGGHNYLSYKNGTKNWFSVVNLSMGYTRKFGNSGSLRVEPYLKLPIKNIGVGNMPIMSTGLNVGFTKKIR